jgi:hypothetical protein
MEAKDYNQLVAKLVRIEERVVTLFKICSRIEMQHDYYSEKIDKNRDDLTMIKTWGAVALFAIPIIVTIIIGRM